MHKKEQEQPQIEILLQQETEYLNYLESERQYWEIEPKKFPHLPVWYVAGTRFLAADNAANIMQNIKYITASEVAKQKLDILTTKIYREEDEYLANSLKDISGEIDGGLMLRRASPVQSADFSGALDRSIMEGDAELISIENFPSLRAMGEKKVLFDKLKALSNRISQIKALQDATKPIPAFAGHEDDLQKIRKGYEEDIQKSLKLFIKFSLQYQAIKD